MATATASEWQVQIWVDDVQEWYGWAHDAYDPSNKKDAERVARIARSKFWKTRVVRVSGCEFCRQDFNRGKDASGWACPYCGKKH